MTNSLVHEIPAEFLEQNIDRSPIAVGYKQSDVGSIPEDWDLQKLGLHATFKTGPFGSALHKSDYVEGGIPIVNPMQIVDGKIEPTSFMSISDSAAKKLSDFLLFSGDIVIGRRGDMGRCAVVTTHEEGWLCGTGSMIIRVRPSCNVSFLQRILSSPSTISAIENASVGSTMINLNQGTLRELQVLFPRLIREQTAIANALSDVDALIQELEKLIAKKQAIKTATMQQLLTGRSRLEQFAYRADGSIKGTKQSELGEIPEDWEVSNIESVSLIPMQNGLFYEPQRKGRGVPLINVGDMYKNAPINIGFLELFDATPNEIKVFKVSAGDLFFTRSSVVPSGIAFCNMYDSERNDVVFDSHLIRVRPNPELVDPKYFYLNCTSKHARRALISEAKTATMTTIDQGAIKRCPVLIPLREEQTAIATILSDMDEDIQSLEHRLSKTRQIKQGMMQELLTGRTRLVKPELV